MRHGRDGPRTSAVAVQLTYVQVQSGEERRFRQSWTREELERFLEEMSAPISERAAAGLACG